MYSNQLQLALQNLLQRVVQFFHPRSLCTTHILADVSGRRKSLVKPVMQQKTWNYTELFGSSTRDRHARLVGRLHIGRRSENNIINASCTGKKNQTTRYILPHHWLYEWFSEFHSCGTFRSFTEPFNPSETRQYYWFVGPKLYSFWVGE